MDIGILEKLTKNLQLTTEEESSVRLPDDLWNESVANYDLCLVGRVVSRKSVNIEAFERTMIRAWDVENGVKFQKLGMDRFLIQFDHMAERKKVLLRSPWAFDKNLVVLQKIPLGQDPLTVNLDKCDFHVQFTGLPISFSNVKVAEYLGNALGKFIDYDEAASRNSWGSAMRIRAVIDVSKPLLRVLCLEGPNAQKLQVTIAYEKLPNFCYFCGIIGHLVKDCRACVELLDDRDTIANDKLSYGEWMRASAHNQNNMYIRGGLSGQNPVVKPTVRAPVSRGNLGILGQRPNNIEHATLMKNHDYHNRDLCKTVTGENQVRSNIGESSKKGKEIMKEIVTDSDKFTPYTIPQLRPNYNTQTQLVLYDPPNVFDPPTQEPTHEIEIAESERFLYNAQSMPKPNTILTTHHPNLTIWPNLTSISSLPNQPPIQGIKFQAQTNQVKKYKPKISVQPLLPLQNNLHSQNPVVEPKKRGRPPLRNKGSVTKGKTSTGTRKEDLIDGKDAKKQCIESNIAIFSPEAGVARQPRLSQ